MKRIGHKLLVLGTLSAVFIAAIPQAHAAMDRTKKIVFVHGYDAFGTAGDDGNATWNNMIATLVARGWSGGMTRVSFYVGDTNYDHSLDHHGSHTVHQGGSAAHTITNGVWSHNQDTPIEHLAYHLAWFIYNHYSSSGKTIELVGYSMGGLIIREMLAQFQMQDPDRPPTLRVQDVVTLGTPHSGTSLASMCQGFASTVQCQQMNPSSSSMQWWAQVARNPQGTNGTDWTLIGSEGDSVVTAGSAVGENGSGTTSMEVRHRVKYSNPDIDHTGSKNYMNQTSNVGMADVDLSTSMGSWVDLTGQPLPVRWTDYALASSTW